MPSSPYARDLGVLAEDRRERLEVLHPEELAGLEMARANLKLHVADYVLLHELAQFCRLNHFARFWREVARLCPWHVEARAWLRGNARPPCERGGRPGMCGGDGQRQ